MAETSVPPLREPEHRSTRLKSGMPASNLSKMSSHWLSKNIKIRVYRTIILPVVLYVCETWSLTVREDHTLRDNLDQNWTK